MVIERESAMSDPLANVAQWITDAVYLFGYPGVAVLTAMGYLHLLVPTSLVLPLSGFLVGQGRFSFIPVLMASTIGGTVGSLILYLAGLWLGEDKLYQFVGRLGRFKLVSESDLDKASALFDRHGGKAVLIGHLMPGVTALISIPAGLKRMSILGFTIYTVLGTAFWNAGHIVLGWVLGAQWTLIERYGHIVEVVVLAAIGLGIFWLVWRRWKTRKN
jgi:membrane protein DedA with SNARE-associated domain